MGGSLTALLAVGAALGAAMGLTGFILLEFFAGGATDMAIIGVWNISNNFTFSAVPMFILLGDLLVASGISGRVYGAVSPLFQRIPGGLLHSNIAVCTVFGAVSGSSAATSAAVGSVAYTELSGRGYRRANIAASLAAGGTLGLLIPPSLSLLIYGAWQEVSIGKLFLAGIIPGLLMSTLFMAYILFDSYRRPECLPAKEDVVPLGTALRGLWNIWPAVILIGSVLGTIYMGIATTTEAAGLGVAATIILGFTVGTLNLRRMIEASISSIATFGALSFILIGAIILTQGIVLLGLPGQITNAITALNFSKYEIFFIIVVFYLIMGIFFDGISLMLVTVPFIYPIMIKVGFDPVWLGVFVTIMIEIGMLTPPIGVNLYVLMAITKGEVSLMDLSKESLPYWIMLLLGTGIITIFPDLVLFLPRTMM